MLGIAGNVKRHEVSEGYVPPETKCLHCLSRQVVPTAVSHIHQGSAVRGSLGGRVYDPNCCKDCPFQVQSCIPEQVPALGAYLHQALHSVAHPSESFSRDEVHAGVRVGKHVDLDRLLDVHQWVQGPLQMRGCPENPIGMRV